MWPHSKATFVGQVLVVRPWIWGPAHDLSRTQHDSMGRQAEGGEAFVPVGEVASRSRVLDGALVATREHILGVRTTLNGGTERTVWETLLEMERCNYHAREKEHGAVAVVLDLGASFRAGQSSKAVLAWATHLNVSRKILRVLCGYFEHQRSVQFEGCVAEPLQTITAFCSSPSGVACSYALFL